VTQQTQHNKKLAEPTLHIYDDPLTCTANAQLLTYAIILASIPSSYNNIPTIIITTKTRKCKVKQLNGAVNLNKFQGLLSI
jgi:hypothetical protein